MIGDLFYYGSDTLRWMLVILILSISLASLIWAQLTIKK
jgi:hypothetical protein